jgi:tetratricopeptide (TPR) repeat protein
MTLIWVGVAPSFYKVITTGSCVIWLKKVYLLFNQNIWLFIPALVCLAFLFWRLLKMSISSRTFQVHWLFAIAFGIVVLYCQPPFDYAIIWGKIDYRQFFLAWLLVVLISTLWWMIKLIFEKVKSKKLKETQDSHGKVPGFSLDNNRVIQHTDPVELYADSIVEKLKNTAFSKDEAFAIGITSEWGAGKTTFLDLLSDKITKVGFAEVVPFNPWMCQSPEQVTRDFFSSLRHQLSDKYPQLSNPIKKYAKHLGSLSIPIHGIANININNFAKEKSLYKKKLELSERFSELDKRVVVTIDDLDRLNSDEVFEVLRLIRNTASLSNVVYLVAYDKAYIIKALENKHISSPSAYLEKIFQLEIQLPIVQEGQVWKVFVDDLRDQLPEGSDIDFVSHDKELVEEVLNTYRRAKRFARLLSLSYHYHSSKKSLHELDKNDILLLDLLHMDVKNVYDILSFKPEKILELNNGIWIYNKKRDNEQNIVLADGSKIMIKETTDKILRRLWGQDDSEPGKYSIRREDYLEEYFTLNVQFSSKDIEAIIDSNDVDALVLDWYKKGKSLDRMPDKINSYSKERLTEQQVTNLFLGLLSYYYEMGPLDIHEKVEEIVPMLKGTPKKLIDWFDAKMDEKCDYVLLSKVAAVLVKLGRIDEEHSKNLIEKMVDRLFENKGNRVKSILDMLSFGYLSEFLFNFKFWGNPKLAQIAFDRIVFVCHKETVKPKIDAFCKEYMVYNKSDDNHALRRLFDSDWKKALWILFNNCIDQSGVVEENIEQSGIIEEKDKGSSILLIKWIKEESEQYLKECYDNGDDCFKKGNNGKAVEYYTEVIRIRQDYDEAHNELALALYREKEFEKALQYANKAIELAPDKSNYYYTRCMVYMGLKQWDDAKDDAIKGLEKGKDYEVLLNLRIKQIEKEKEKEFETEKEIKRFEREMEKEKIIIRKRRRIAPKSPKQQ